MAVREIDPDTLQVAGRLLTAVAAHPENAIRSVWTPNLDAMGPRHDLIEARDRAVEVLYLLADRAAHQGRVDLAAYEAHRAAEQADPPPSVGHG